MYYATLSDQGYIEDTKLILARMIAGYMATGYHQSLSYPDDMASLPRAYHLGRNEPETFKNEIIKDLTKLFSSRFSSDLIEIQAEVRMDDKNVKADILLFVSIVDDKGMKYSIGGLTDYDGKVLGKIVEINNYGDGKNKLRERM